MKFSEKKLYDNRLASMINPETDQRERSILGSSGLWRKEIVVGLQF